MILLFISGKKTQAVNSWPTEIRTRPVCFKFLSAVNTSILLAKVKRWSGFKGLVKQAQRFVVMLPNESNYCILQVGILIVIIFNQSYNNHTISLYVQ